MARIRRTRLARDDYREIWDFIAADHVDAADRLLRKIDAKLEDYAKMPGMGKPRDDLRRGIRSFPVGQYLVFYRPVADGIELLRVLHGARDISRKFFQ